MLEQCDLSNTQMIKGTMQRTKLTDCKLVGISLTEAFLLDSSIERCVARYANLYGSKMRHVRLAGLGLIAPRSPAALGTTSLSRCLLVRAELFGTLFHGMDLSDSDIGISLSGGELRGAKVNLEQAMLDSYWRELPLKSKVLA